MSLFIGYLAGAIFTTGLLYFKRGIAEKFPKKLYIQAALVWPIALLLLIGEDLDD